MTFYGWPRTMLLKPGSTTFARADRPLLTDFARSHPAIVSYGKINITDFIFALILVDVLGAGLLAVCGFRLLAMPLGYAPRQLWPCLAGFVLAWGTGSYLLDFYSRQTLSAGFRRLLTRAMMVCAETYGLLLLFGFAFGLLSAVPRVWFLGWAGSVFVWVALARLCWRGYLSYQIRHGRCLERALVLADSPEAAARAMNRVERESSFHIRGAAIAALPGVPEAPPLDWIEATVRDGFVDRIIVARFADAMHETNALLRRLSHIAVDVTLIPDLDDLQAPILKVDRIGTLPTIDLDFHPLSPMQAALKRTEDILIAGALLLCVLPLLAVVGLAIRLDSRGPVFFRQIRVGFNGRSFRVWKFRTMYAHARDDHAMQQTSRQDSRVTRVGRFLRRTSIDEMPQLFNVLAGDMAIVGPRPHARGMTAVGTPLHTVVEDYAARHRLKPGITGWAQVNGCRGEVDSHEKLRRRVAFDFEYIENWSLGLDLWIIIRTATLVVFDTNAY